MGKKQSQQASPPPGTTPLHAAAQRGDADAVRELVFSGASTHARNQFGRTPLHLAAQNGHLNIVQILTNPPLPPLLPGAPSLPPPLSTSPSLACSSLPSFFKFADFSAPYPSIASSNSLPAFPPLSLDPPTSTSTTLIKQLATVINQEDKYMLTPLHLAAQNGHSEVVKLLLTRGACAGAGLCGNTPLHCAAAKGHTAAVRVLLSNGADGAVRNTFRRTALEIALAHGHQQTAHEIAQDARSSCAVLRGGMCDAETQSMLVVALAMAWKRTCEAKEDKEGEGNEDSGTEKPHDSTIAVP